MGIQSPTRPASKLLDKRTLQQAVADLDERMGFIQDPTGAVLGLWKPKSK